MSQADKAAILVEEGGVSLPATTYSGLEVQLPDNELTPLKAVAMMPTDDVDFSSGFEDQHRQEYGQKKKILVTPPATHLAWYRDCRTIMLLIFLWLVLLSGTVLLIMLVFTTNPWKIFATTVTYLVASILMIYIEVKSAQVR